MAEFLEDPSVLTKDKLKSELTANNVPLPSGEHKKEVYVQLYLKNLTVQNQKKSAPIDTFSSDEELPVPVVSNKSRSGRVCSSMRLSDQTDYFHSYCDKSHFSWRLFCFSSKKSLFVFTRFYIHFFLLFCHRKLQKRQTSHAWRT